MKKRTCITGVAVTLIAMTSVAVMAKERTPDGSFLRYRANTVAALKNEIATDTVAQARYSAHFGVPTKDVLSTIGGGLKLVSLSAPTRVEMWYVKGKTLSHKTKLLPKGSQVFATQSGKPVLAWSCGNPLRVSIEKKVIASAKPPIAKNIKEKVLPAVESISTLAVTAPPSLITETVPVIAATEPALAMPTLGAAAAPVITGISPAAVSSGGGIYNLGWLAGLAALTSRRETSPTVPEPASMLVLATGLGSAMTLARYRRRK